MKKRFEIVQVKSNIGLGGAKGSYFVQYKVYHTRAMADLREFYVYADDELDAYNRAKIQIAEQLKG